jgi:hypothetical protein
MSSPGRPVCPFSKPRIDHVLRYSRCPCGCGNGSHFVVYCISAFLIEQTISVVAQPLLWLTRPRQDMGYAIEFMCRQIGAVDRAMADCLRHFVLQAPVKVFQGFQHGRRVATSTSISRLCGWSIPIIREHRHSSVA